MSRKMSFKAESKRLLNLMINSIYTHKEIFLRELISNASDAIDKRYYFATHGGTGMDRSEFFIRIEPDLAARTLTITDNGCGMTAEELQHNLGTIAKSGTQEFTQTAEKGDAEVIGQFGVGFYSAFMVASKIQVYSRTESGEANLWESEGDDGFTVTPCDYPDVGTKIVLSLREDSEDNDYSQFLNQYTLEGLVKKYSDYIRYPIRMTVESHEHSEDGEDKVTTEDKVLNSMVPLWRKAKSEITRDEYNAFYRGAFGAFEDPIAVLHIKAEGLLSYTALLFIPKTAPFDFFSKSYKHGLRLYSNGVSIMDSCEELLPEYFGFVRGLVDSPDLSLNISREMLQHDRQLSAIANNLKKKLQTELLRLLREERETYESFYRVFGLTLKYGVYQSYGVNAEFLQDLLMFHSLKQDRLITLREYVDTMSEGQEHIYYAAGDSLARVKKLPQTELILDKGYDILCLVDDVDEFALKMMRDYDKREFMSVSDPDLELSSDEEKKAMDEKREANQGLTERLEKALEGKIAHVVLTDRLKSAAVCLTGSEGVSVEMYKVLMSMPNAKADDIPTDFTLELNPDHPVFSRLEGLNDDELKEYADLLYDQARLLAGLPLDDPAAFCASVCKLM